MISYAQNAEDAVLARLFDRQEGGFYVDIGAGHPILDSVTKHFYDRGWRGLNVEPSKTMFDLLCELRPLDINVHAAVTDRIGTVPFYQAPEGNLGASTLDETIVHSYEEEEGRFSRTTVRATTLSSLLSEYGISSIDLLKIDVEGHEATILRDTDWAVVRPRVIVVEAVQPGTTTPSHERWEGILLDAGYLCTLFDGVNRFYVQGKDEEARAALSTPANVFDDIAPWRWLSQIEGAKAHIAAVERARREAEARIAELRSRDPLSQVVRRGARALRRLIGR